jgi:acyl dehydratase
MSEFYLKVGDVFHFAKTIGESDVYLFAGITGDLSPNHVDEHAMAATVYGGRIAHGALIVGYMSACSTMATARARDGGETPVSLGYDRIRFVRAVRIGDTIRVAYRIAEIDPVRRRAVADVRVTNQRDELVAVASHILKWTANDFDLSASGVDPA